MSQVKIVATIGPRTGHPETIRALLRAGMGVVRLNGAHGDLDWHARMISLVREIAPDLPILLDTPGRKVRVSRLQEDCAVSQGDTVVLRSGGEGLERREGAPRVGVTAADLHESVSAGDVILADAGGLRLTVVDVARPDVICRAESPGMLQSGKGIHLPGVRRGAAPALTSRDQELLTLAKSLGVDFVGISFVESADQVQRVREFINQSPPRILSKLETQQGIECLEEIVEASDVLMVDRGDLSIETSFEVVTLLQKRILDSARRAGKPVIVATELLYSMVGRPLPTKAEVSDISNTVLDGTTAIMLSEETAVGQFPVEAVQAMRRVADAASFHFQTLLDERHPIGPRTIPNAVRDAVALICRQSPVTKIVAITVSGYAARMVAACMPRQPILAVSNNRATARSLNLFFGTEGIYLDIPFSRTSTDHLPACLAELWRRGKLVDEDLVLVTSVGYPKSGNRMNLIEMHRIGDLRESLAWTR